MKHLALALPLALAVATPASAQRIDGTCVQFGEICIPVDQARPPANAPWIAFRPRCDQMVGEVQPDNTVQWGVQTPDGRMNWLRTLPMMEDSAARLDLSAAGICKLGTDVDGAIQVPIMFAENVPQLGVAQATATPVSDVRPAADTPTGGRSPWVVILSGVAMAGIAGFGMAILNRQRKEIPTATQHPDYDPFEEI